MAMDLPTLRKLLALDPADPLSRFALGKKLFETADASASPEANAADPALIEAAAHLRVANEKSPAHLATYHIYSQVLIRLGQKDEARKILIEGIRRVSAVGEGMGRDLGPAMRKMLAEL
jgi:predicted Zn-dependent protease